MHKKHLFTYNSHINDYQCTVILQNNFYTRRQQNGLAHWTAMWSQCWAPEVGWTSAYNKERKNTTRWPAHVTQWSKHSSAMWPLQAPWFSSIKAVCRASVSWSKQTWLAAGRRNTQRRQG